MKYLYKSPGNWKNKIIVLVAKKKIAINKVTEIQKEIDIYQEKIDNFPYK